MKVDRQFIKQIEIRTGLVFREGIESGNLCYRYDNMNLQSEFKEVFTGDDLRLFLASFTDSPVALPRDREGFWDAVEKGRQSAM